MSLFDRFFPPRTGGSKDDAKSRLKILLVHDQVDLTPSQMDAMRAEILAVIARYAEIEATKVDLRLERSTDGVNLISSVAVRRVNARLAVAGV
ncbi:MAG: cell division topological specificity factor MinE [Myxococcales bacterium]|nr:cell division topological specificity factor MinE [Myxococcales bacterium]